MTDKRQVIIDGVDVSGCNKFEWSCTRDMCKYFSNCYYKQLKRKEEESKELREDKIYTDMACEQLAKENDRLVDKINELQTEIGKFRKVYFRVRTEAQGLRVSALSSLRTTERFETPKDRSLHTTRLARILHIATNIEKILEEIDK